MKVPKKLIKLAKKIGHDEIDRQKPYIKSDVDRDYDRAVQRGQQLYSEGRIA